MRLKTISHEFVDLVPSTIEEGVLYISIPYKTATHKCACGCGEIVVTPIRPTDWMLIWDGDAVSLYPSIGNWSIPCQSHYFIRYNRIVWAQKWNTAKIKAGRAKDKAAKARYYSKSQTLEKSQSRTARNNTPNKKRKKLTTDESE